MNLRDLKYLTVIAEERNITRAASRLFVAQPALSQCVQKIEKELGAAVFVRAQNGVTVTREGQRFVEFARRMIAEHEQLLNDISDLKNAIIGEVRVGLTEAQAAYILPYVLPQFSLRHPQINVMPVDMLSDELEAALLRGEQELGILRAPVKSPDLETFELSADEMVVIPRSTTRYQKYIYYREDDTRPYLNLEFFRNEPLVLTQKALRSRQVCDQIFQKAGIDPVVRLSCQYINTINALAQVDYGSTMLPSKLVSETLRRRGVFAIERQYSVPYPLLVAVRRNAVISAAAQRLLDLLRELAGTF